MGKIEKIEVITFWSEEKDYAKGLYDNDAVAGSHIYQPGVSTKRPVLMVKIYAEGGLTGEYAYWAATGTREQAIDAARIAVGRNWSERERIYRVARRHSRPKHQYGLGWIDIALWDLAGKSFGASLTEMLGGFRKEIPVYASSHNGDRLGSLSTKEQVSDFFLSLQEKGFKGFKMHSWHEGNKREEAANIFHMRETLGEEATLMLDPACVFDSLSDAIYVGKAAEEAGFKWFEDPLRPLGIGIYQHRKLRESLNIPILQTEHVPGPESKADFLLNGGTDILRVDAHLDIGVTGCLKTIHFAESLGVNVEPHVPSPVHRHLVASMQSTSWYEIANVSPHMSDPSPQMYLDGYNDDVNMINPNGTVSVPEGPGMGVKYDWDMIKKNLIDIETITLDS